MACKASVCTASISLFCVDSESCGVSVDKSNKVAVSVCFNFLGLLGTLTLWLIQRTKYSNNNKVIFIEKRKDDER